MFFFKWWHFFGFQSIFGISSYFASFLLLLLSELKWSISLFFFIFRGICENAMNLPQRNAWNTSNNLENFLKIARSKNFRKSFTEFLASRRNCDNFNRSHVYRKFANPWAKKILEQHTKNVSKFRHATSI